MDSNQTLDANSAIGAASQQVSEATSGTPDSNQPMDSLSADTIPGAPEGATLSADAVLVESHSDQQPTTNDQQGTDNVAEDNTEARPPGTIEDSPQQGSGETSATQVSGNAALSNQQTTQGASAGVLSSLLVKARAKIQERKVKKMELIMTKLGGPSLRQGYGGQGKSSFTNSDVQKLLHVSNETARRYLDVLEREGKVRREGRKYEVNK